MFKADWEKTSVTHSLPDGMVEKMVRLVYPDKKLISNELLAGGCANLNIKIWLDDQKNPFVLRVYLRDKDAAYREQKLAELLKQTVPVPLTHYIGELDGYHFAITEFMPGIPLRDLLQSDTPHDLSAIMYEVGTVLSKITAHEFSRAGFFDQALNIIPHLLSDDYLIFAKNCLKHATVLSVLSSDVISKISQALDRYVNVLPDGNEKCLVHADFDPANILVHKVDDVWKVSGVLDWEFSFSGSMLWDVANMLRYAHQMPREFQDGFLKGLASGGVTLPQHWPITIPLLNLLSLLDCLKRSDPKNRPKQCADIRELINHILLDLNLMSDSPLEWSIAVLLASGFQIEDISPETIQVTPWSNVCRFKTDKGYVYLKTTPPALSIEPNVIQILRNKFDARVPIIIEANQELDCFLMQDAGIQLYEYFKSRFDAEIFISTIQKYSALQILSMNEIEALFDIGVHDWRLEKLPTLYLELIERENLLIDDGLSSADLNKLKKLASKFNDICDRLSQYQIKNAFGHADFHLKNILIDKNTKKTTIIDLGEVVISHPFYSLHNCLHMAKENLSLSSTQYHQILESCLEPWLSLEPRENLSDILSLIQETWMIHAVLGEMRLIDSVNQEAFKALRREGRLSKKLRVWIDSH